MVQMSLPRLVAPGERVDVPVTVFAMEEGIGEVDVKIAESNGVDWSTTRKSTRFNSSGQKRCISLELSRRTPQRCK